MSHDDTAFKPFVPPQPMFEDPPSQTATAGKPDKPAKTDKPAKPKRDRKPRKPKTSKPKIPKPPKHDRPKRGKKKAAAKKRVTRPLPAALAGALNRGEKVLQQRAKAAGIKLPKRHYGSRVQKVDLDIGLAIGALLKPTDLKTFGDIREHLHSVNKATRKRVLAAISKVFE